MASTALLVTVVYLQYRCCVGRSCHRLLVLVVEVVAVVVVVLLVLLVLVLHIALVGALVEVSTLMVCFVALAVPVLPSLLRERIVL